MDNISNYDKLELLRIHGNDNIYDPDGGEIQCKMTMKYLGAQISATGMQNCVHGSEWQSKNSLH